MALSNELPVMLSEFPKGYLVGYGGAASLFAFSAFVGAQTSVYLRLSSWVLVFLISLLNFYEFPASHNINLIDKILEPIIAFLYLPPTNFIVTALTVRAIFSLRSPKITALSSGVIFFIVMLLHVSLTIYIRYVAI